MAKRTAKGNVTAETREERATLSGGRFPIFDRKSALAALRLRGRARTKEERRAIINKAARYAPVQARAAREADEKAGKI
jgi:hypothetical protein